jgi:hypothetical protein
LNAHLEGFWRNPPEQRTERKVLFGEGLRRPDREYMEIYHRDRINQGTGNCLSVGACR